ncbi:MAG: RNA 2',3'-cyclic phosphodiesterase [Acidimicrobiales bacterium]|nr:MAG: RNA 2',3'-cyclic phosphodiesterase [Acidimicrobiales bacterium]
MRLFVAVWPAPEVVTTLAELPRPGIDGVRWTKPEQWHVTLRFLGEVTDLDGALGALDRIDVAPMVGTVAEMGPATACFGRHVLQVPVEGLDALAAEVLVATGEVGGAPGAPFSGHLTLARARSRGIDLRPLAGVAVSVRWPVAAITLVASSLGGTGSRYRILASRLIPGTG